MKLKNIAIGIGAVVLAGTLFAKNKTSQVTNIVNNLKFKLSKINNINFGFNNITINLDLVMQNPTDQSFSINTGNAIQLHKVELYTDTGIKIAEAFKQVNDINLNAFGEMLITNVQVVIPTSNLGSTVLSLLRNSPSKIITQAHISVYGKNYMI